MRRVFIALGSNMGDREQFLRDAVIGLPDVVAVSNMFETDPVGGVVQDDFLNAVIELSTNVSGLDLLSIGQGLEAAADRKRVIVNGPRTLDVDILFIEGEAINEPDLTVPHPRMWDRRFVMAPLQELAPELVSDDTLRNAEGEVRVYIPKGEWRADLG